MKRLLRLLLWLLLGLVLVLLVNTIRFSSKQIQVDPIVVKPLDDAPVERLAEAVRFPTISTQLAQDSSAFWAFDQWLENTYPLVDSLLALEKYGDLSRLYHWPGKNPNLNPIMLIAHLDVVAVQEASAWEQPAFKGVIEDGFIWGRGTLDDKVSVLGILEAAELLLGEGYAPERSLYFGFGHDEEVGGTGAQAMAAALKAKGVDLEYILDEGYFVIENALLRTTTAPTIIKAGIQENVLLTQAQATVNFRIIPGETAESVKKRVENLVGSESLTVNYVKDGIFKDPSPVSSTDAFGFQVISKTIREIFPEAIVAPGVMVGAADVSYYSEVSEQLYRFLPLQLTQPDLKRIHGNNERIGVEQYKKSIRFYEQLIRNSCK